MKGSSRYDRQKLLKDWNQKKIQRSCVLIAGVGALGSVVAVSLAQMGIGKLVLCDFDTVEMSNLSRQLLFQESDVGESKVIAAKKHLKVFNPDVEVQAIVGKIEDLTRAQYEQANVLVDGLDTFEARRWLNSLSISEKIPLVHGGMYGWYGNCQVVLPFKTACLECQPLIPKERLQKKCTPPGQKRKDEEEPPEKFPSISSVSFAIGALQTQEVLKLLLNAGKPLTDFLFYDALAQKFTPVPIVRNPNCIICGDTRLEGIDFAVMPGEKVRAVKDRLIMTFGIGDPMNLVVKGIIQEDDAKLMVENKDLIFVYNKELAKPLKFRAVVDQKKKKKD